MEYVVYKETDHPDGRMAARDIDRVGVKSIAKEIAHDYRSLAEPNERIGILKRYASGRVDVFQEPRLHGSGYYRLVAESRDVSRADSWNRNMTLAHAAQGDGWAARGAA